MDEVTEHVIEMKLEYLRCPICPFELKIALPSYVTVDQTLMNQMDMASKRQLADAMADHLRAEHGLISVLVHQHEMNLQADSSFKAGVREGEKNLESSLRKVVLQSMRDALAPVIDPEDE